MKLLLVNDKFVRGDGQGRVNFEVARHAVRSGHDVTLLASEVDTDLAAICRWQRVNVGKLRPQLLRNRVFSMLCARAIRKYRPYVDIVMTNGTNTLAAADVNAVHFVHGSWLRSPAHTSRTRRDWYGAYSYLLTVVSAREERIAFSRARTIIAVSKLVQEELISIGVPRAKIKVILNGVDTNEFAPGAGDRALAGLPIDKPIAIFAGDMTTPRKNLDTVLKALCDVPMLHLVVVGSLNRNPYPAVAASLGLSDRVHFFGFRLDIAKVFALADFFVFPSRYDAFGLVILEALAAGLPVITAQSAGGSEIIEESSGFVLDNCEDYRGLAEAMLRLSTDDVLRARQRLGARAVAMKHRWDFMSQEYVDHINALGLNPPA